MKFSADLIFTGEGKPIHKGLVETNDQGMITNLSEYSDDAEVQHFEGIITPGFFNAHIHLELAGAKFPNSQGLSGFLYEMKQWLKQQKNYSNIKEIQNQDKFLYEQGIQFCADISNTEKTINVKKHSKINYFTFLEVYESLNDNTKEKFEKICLLEKLFDSHNLLSSVVPHSFYSLSDEMTKLVRLYNAQNKRLSSVHFKEQVKENNIYKCKNEIYSMLNDNYLEKFQKKFFNKKIHVNLSEVFDAEQKVLLVHGIYMTEKEAISIRNEFKNSALCICPSSNLNLESRMADNKTLLAFSNRVFLGTDSQASNSEMNFQKEILLFQNYYNENVFDVLKKATSHPAEFFDCSNMGIIKPGNKPGLNIISKIDFQNEKITNESKVKRLV
jgi:aminodeoxyfutalosine deaminase